MGQAKLRGTFEERKAQAIAINKPITQPSKTTVTARSRPARRMGTVGLVAAMAAMSFRDDTL